MMKFHKIILALLPFLPLKATTHETQVQAFCFGRDQSQAQTISLKLRMPTKDEMKVVPLETLQALAELSSIYNSNSDFISTSKELESKSSIKDREQGKSTSNNFTKAQLPLTLKVTNISLKVTNEDTNLREEDLLLEEDLSLFIQNLQALEKLFPQSPSEEVHIPKQEQICNPKEPVDRIESQVDRAIPAEEKSTNRLAKIIDNKHENLNPTNNFNQTLQPKNDKGPNPTVIPTPVFRPSTPSETALPMPSFKSGKTTTTTLVPDTKIFLPLKTLLLEPQALANFRQTMEVRTIFDLLKEEENYLSFIIWNNGRPVIRLNLAEIEAFLSFQQAFCGACFMGETHISNPFSGKSINIDHFQNQRDLTGRLTLRAEKFNSLRRQVKEILKLWDQKGQIEWEGNRFHLR